ncbi:TadE/TadG family type IV pilus assembly protein [Vibrio sp. EA2]|uniref:TadE/TadG family type IV pilus assembly protein n=1 Tax=Vibrio sp. EA2 TaxID=3079860 RepID=UPI00294A8442|nr:TadE/TadG family type IV pilus assembly protein [Vibrio sp. EA2]MDV6251372.1 TadE/TadG family type IV pilus assembly protein [Vibrio sp. EA2]
MTKWILKKRGVTQIEFLLIALAVLLVIFSIIEFALYFYSIQMANEVTRRAARLATVCYIADRDDIPELPAVKGLYPPGFSSSDLKISYLTAEEDDDGNIKIEALTDAEVAEFSSASPTIDLNEVFSHIRFVKAEADYEFKFFVLAALIKAVGVSPRFQTILPAESLGVLRPEAGLGKHEDC